MGLEFRKGSAGLQSSEGLTEAGGSTSEVGRSQGWQVDAGHWPGALFSLDLGLSTKLLGDMAVGFLQSEPSKRQDGSSNTFYLFIF